MGCFLKYRNIYIASGLECNIKCVNKRPFQVVNRFELLQISTLEFVLVTVSCSVQMTPLSSPCAHVPDGVAGAAQTHQPLHFLQFAASGHTVSLHIYLRRLFSSHSKGNYQIKPRLYFQLHAFSPLDDIVERKA